MQSNSGDIEQSKATQQFKSTERQRERTERFQATFVFQSLSIQKEFTFLKSWEKRRVEGMKRFRSCISRICLKFKTYPCCSLAMPMQVCGWGSSGSTGLRKA